MLQIIHRVVGGYAYRYSDDAQNGMWVGRIFGLPNQSRTEHRISSFCGIRNLDSKHLFLAHQLKHSSK